MVILGCKTAKPKNSLLKDEDASWFACVVGSLVEWAIRNGIGYAWHTGSVPQQKRRGEILAFRDDPNYRLFLSTDSGGGGLNLQQASVVINCELPWNPARLEQRIARLQQILSIVPGRINRARLISPHLPLWTERRIDGKPHSRILLP